MNLTPNRAEICPFDAKPSERLVPIKCPRCYIVTMRLHLLPFACAVFLAACSIAADGPDSRHFVLASVAPDLHPSFVVDSSKPFVIELGRGSGWHGLEMIKLDETGSIKLFRFDHRGGGGFETSSLRLPPADLAALVDKFNTMQITWMGRSYSDPSIADGTQWVLWIQQTPHEKGIYFNNAFPDQITSFAKDLDAAMAAAGIGSVTWIPAQKQGKDEQDSLWARIH
jgi:hypothetical protein